MEKKKGNIIKYYKIRPSTNISTTLSDKKELIFSSSSGQYFQIKLSNGSLFTIKYLYTK